MHQITSILKIQVDKQVGFLMVLYFLTVCCNTTVDTPSELLQWMNNPKNGLVKEKRINGFKITAKYLPPQYLALQELKANEGVKYDSLINDYSRFRTFLLTIAPDEDHWNSDVMFYDVINETAYKTRVYDLNFNVDEFISLHTKQGELFPVLHTLENTYELAKHKSIYLVFADNELITDLLHDDEIDLRFSDELFRTGLSHFIFKKKNMDAVAAIKIIQD